MRHSRSSTHVYLDTVTLGALGQRAQRPARCSASARSQPVRYGFATLGFGAGRLRGLFTNPGSWRILDGLIAVAIGLRWESR